MPNKTVKVLDKSTLTTEQKLGLLMTANATLNEADFENILEMIREHRLGAVWFQPENRTGGYRDHVIERVLEVADYPVLIMCDSEEGVAPYKIPQLISLSAAGGGEEDAYAFGRLSAAQLRAMGYNAVCNPILDLCRYGNAPAGRTTRTLGGDMEAVTREAIAMARGIRDAGLLTISKHYPGGSGKLPWDSHMREGYEEWTEEEMIRESLPPYLALMKEGLMDGTMVRHALYKNIDPELPSSLSKKVIDIIRRLGFDGFIITDALVMMGVALKYGKEKPNPMAIAAGCDLTLPWTLPSKEAYAALLDGYRSGLFDEARLDEAVDRVLEAQRKVLAYAEAGDPTVRDEDVRRIMAIHENCVSTKLADGVEPSISKDGKHLFVIVYERNVADVDYTPGPRDWFFPDRVRAEILARFPNSDTVYLPQFPETNDNIPLFNRQLSYDDLIFITYAVPRAYLGRECLTSRLVDLMDALQSNNRIAAHLHFGNPYVAADAPFIERVIMGYSSHECITTALDVLGGDKEAKGVIPYPIEFHKKGHIFY